MKITKEQYDALPDFMKAMYAADGDGYVATFKTAEEHETEVSGLKANNQKLVDEKRTEAQKRTAAEEAQRKAQEESDRKAGNVDAIDQSWAAKFAAHETATKGKLDSYHAQISQLTVGNAATSLASKLFGKNAGLFKNHVADRMSLEEGEDGSLKVRIMKDGKPSALTIDELEKEFRTDAQFTDVLVGTAPGGTPKGPTLQAEEKKNGPIGMTHSFGITTLQEQAKKLIDAMPDDE